MACQFRQPKYQSLLELPLEIRFRIYEFLLVDSTIYIVLVSVNPEDRRLHIHGSDVGLLLTCRQIYHEASLEWYTANLWTVGFPPALGYFLRSTSPKALARVRHLSIQVHELPDLNTKLLPSLKMLVIDFTTDRPAFMTGRWYELDSEKIYSRFADEAIARVHSTFKVLITELHEESRLFHIGLFVRVSREGIDLTSLRTRDLFVNLDTKLVQLTTRDLPTANKHDSCLEEEPSEASEAEHSPEPSPHLLPRRCKFPPGREGPSSGEDKDERGSTRDSEQEDSYDDDDDDDSDDDEDEDEETKRVREAAAVKRVDWEDVKRIIEHPSEDEQSLAGDTSENEAEKENGEEAEEKLSGANAPQADADRADVKSGSGDENDDNSQASESRLLKPKIDQEIVELVLESGPEPQPESQPEPEQEPLPPPPRISSPVSRSETGPSKSSQIPGPAPDAQEHVADDQHQRIEERVICTTSWPEPVPSSTTTPNFSLTREILLPDTDLQGVRSRGCTYHSATCIPSRQQWL